MFSGSMTPMQFPMEYYYGLSLLVGAVVNWVLAALLAFDEENIYQYNQTPRYLRARHLTALAFAVIGIGYVLHWWFMFQISEPTMATLLTLAYLHLGAGIWAMGHIGLLDRTYLTNLVVVREVVVLLLGLVLYGMGALVGGQWLFCLGVAYFALHMLWLSFCFFSWFHHTYVMLGSSAEYGSLNDSDRYTRWMFFGWYLMLLYLVGSVVVSLVNTGSALPNTLLMVTGVPIFTYLYKALENFRLFVEDADRNIVLAEQYVQSEWGKQYHPKYVQNREQKNPLTCIPLLSGFFKQW